MHISDPCAALLTAKGEIKERGKELMDTDNSTVTFWGSGDGGVRGYGGINGDGEKSDFVTLKNETLHNSICGRHKF